MYLDYNKRKYIGESGEKWDKELAYQQKNVFSLPSV